MLKPRVAALFYLQLASFAHIWTCKGDENECLTPDSVKGTCINLQECPEIYAMANNFKEPITLEKLTFLMQSQCGFNGTNPKVCCPE